MGKPTSPAEAYKALLSGQILGAVIKALQLQDPVLASKTAQRYFSGLHVGDDRKNEIFEAIGRALVETGFIPHSHFLEQERFPLPKVISTAIAWYADRWDGLSGYMRSTSAPVDRPDLAAISFLRLAIIDLALRTSAVLWLADLPIPAEGTPLWAEEKGGAKYLRQLLDMCRDTKPTRDQLAERLGVSYNTIDSWLDTDSRPSGARIDGISEELTRHIPDLHIEVLTSRLHRHYTLCALCDLLAEHLGRDAVIDLATALVRFTSRNLVGLREYSKLPTDDAAKSQFFILLRGSEVVSTEHLLRALWRQESDPVWGTDLLAASKPWYLRLQHIAQQLGGLDKAIQFAHDEYGIPKETAEKLMDKVLRDVQADPTRLHITDPSDLEGKMFVRVKGDAKFSARNRMAQYAGATADGDIQTAIVHVRRAVELQPENAEYHFHLGASLGKAAEVEEGIQECWIAAQLDPGCELPHVEVGIILLNAGRNEEAREHLEAVAHSQGNVSPHLAFNLGIARLRCNDPAGALEILEKAIEAKPDHGLALDVAARCAFLVGNKVKGRRLAKLADQLGQSETYQEWKEGRYQARADR
jgi:Flp pilus assembly protein TadD/transcriptional regulator with XRE-family HTH domain